MKDVKWPVLVTGASSGIGLETALHLAAQGFAVCATMRDLTRRDALESEASRRNLHVQVEALDITDPASIEAIVRLMVDRWRHLRPREQCRIPTAGLLRRHDRCGDSQCVRVNLFERWPRCGPCCPSCAARRGRIVIVSSIGGLLGSLALSAYCGSKHGLEGFGEALSLEVCALGIQVALVEPAIVQTEIWRGNKRVARGALDPDSPYFEWFRAEERLADRFVVTAPTTTLDVAKAVRHALAADRPRLRYLVGRRASLLLTLRRYLPAALFERLYFGEVIRRVTGTRI